MKLVPDRKLPANRAPLPKKLGARIIQPKSAEIVRTRDFFLEMKDCVLRVFRHLYGISIERVAYVLKLLSFDHDQLGALLYCELLRRHP